MAAYYYYYSNAPAFDLGLMIAASLTYHHHDAIDNALSQISIRHADEDRSTLQAFILF